MVKGIKKLSKAILWVEDAIDRIRKIESDAIKTIAEIMAYHPYLCLMDGLPTGLSNFSESMSKNFLFPQNMVRADVRNGFFGGLYRCGSAASGVSDWGVSKTVRANSIILHTLGKGKCIGSAAQGAAASSYCNLGVNENSRFRLGKENF